MKFVENGKSRKRFLAELTGLCGILAAAVVTNGFIPAPGMQNWVFLLIPYMIQLVAAVSVCYGMYRLLTGGDPIRRYVYDASVCRLPFRAVTVMVTAAVLAAAEIIYIVLYGSEENGWWAACFLVLELVVELCSMAMRKKIRGENWEICTKGKMSENRN